MKNLILVAAMLVVSSLALAANEGASSQGPSSQTGVENNEGSNVCPPGFEVTGDGQCIRIGAMGGGGNG